MATVKNQFAKIGDIYVSTWGYSMQIVDFYQVTRVTKAMVEIMPIASKSTSGDGWRGECVAVPNAFVKDEKFPVMRRNDEWGFRVNDASHARPWDGEPKYYDYMD